MKNLNQIATIAANGLKNNLGMEKIPNALKIGAAYLTKKAPELMTGMGIGLMVGGAVQVGKDTLKAKAKLEDAGITGKITKKNIKDVVLTAWDCYIPSASLILSGAAFVIGGLSVEKKRHAAALSLLAMINAGSEEYMKRVTAVVGESAQEKIKDDTLTTPVVEVPPIAEEIIETGGGDTLCWDPMSGRYFRSSVVAIKNAMAETNMMIVHAGEASLNDFYDYLGLDRIKLGNAVGWRDEFMNIRFVSKLANSEGVNPAPCLVLDYHGMMIYDEEL